MNWLIGIFQSINDSALADNIRGTVWVFPTIETIHVVAIVLVFGSITRLDLRLLGLVWTNRAVTEVAEEMLPFTWVAFVIAAVFGLLLWSSKPLTYFGIAFFDVKMKHVVVTMVVHLGAEVDHIRVAEQRVLELAMVDVDAAHLEEADGTPRVAHDGKYAPWFFS